MVGLFINTIPVRVTFSSEDSIFDLLLSIQRNALESEKHQYHPLADIQMQSSAPGKLFDHIMVFENYPELSDEASAGKHDFTVSNVHMFVESNYDLVIVIDPADSINIKIEYNTYRYSKDMIETFLAQFDQVITQVIEAAGVEAEQLLVSA